MPVGEAGLLALHKDDPGLMIRYWNRDDETANAFRRDWFLTGDMAALDQDGYLEYLGRADDLMNAQGYRVSPQEVEDILTRHPSVQECACAELQVREDVRVIGAFVVPKTDTAINAEDLSAFAGARLASYKVPREFVFVDTLPHTATGKVQRRKLAGIYEQLKQA